MRREGSPGQRKLISPIALAMNGDRLAMAIRWVGREGQGVVFAGMVLARAAASYENRNGQGLFVNQTQSYGQAATGSLIRCDVVISEERAYYPFVEIPDYLMAMSQSAYDRFIEQTSIGTRIIFDEDEIHSRPDRVHYAIPASRLAKEMGRKGSANMILLGALIGISHLLGAESVLQAIANASPSSTGENNRKAFSEGLNIGRAITDCRIAGESG